MTECYLIVVGWQTLVVPSFFCSSLRVIGGRI